MRAYGPQRKGMIESELVNTPNIYMLRVDISCWWDCWLAFAQVIISSTKTKGCPYVTVCTTCWFQRVSGHRYLHSLIQPGCLPFLRLFLRADFEAVIDLLFLWSASSHLMELPSFSSLRATVAGVFGRALMFVLPCFVLNWLLWKVYRNSK